MKTEQPLHPNSKQIGGPIAIGGCVIDLIAAEIDGRSPPQLLVMMTPSVVSPGENVTFPYIPAELERRFKAVAEQLRAQAGERR